jgi:hypothetical protein
MLKAEALDQIKRLTIIALVSDDSLMDRLVLKGGNAIRFSHAAPVRQSLDLDFSIDGELGDLKSTRTLIEKLLVETFLAEGFAVLDVKLAKAPPNLKNDLLGEFWGGFTLEFKVIAKSDFDRFEGTPHKRRTNALPLGKDEQRAFVVDLSKHEYVVDKVAKEIDGYTVYMYSPLMIVCEKIRAICQQMPEYRKIVHSDSARPRARDFFDIHYLNTTEDIDLASDDAWRILKGMFDAKRVPMQLIGLISERREFHREGFEAVKATVRSDHELLEFDQYVDLLVAQLRPLQARWEKEPPLR